MARKTELPPIPGGKIIPPSAADIAHAKGPSDFHEAQKEIDRFLGNAARVREAWLVTARHNINYFVPFVMRDEGTGAPLIQSENHIRWHDLMERHDRAVVWGHVESGKTSQLVARILWELGRNPSERVAVVSNTYGQAEKIVRAVAKYIESSPELRLVFPHMKPSTRRGDSFTAHALTIERPIISRDPSVVACGYHGNILGARLSRLYIDDAIDYENSRTESGRQEFFNWMVSTLFGRLLDDAKVVFTGNAWHPDDAMHRLEANERWAAMRFPVLDPITGAPTWPERWSPERIERKRVELGPLEFARQMLCQARDDASSRFKKEWIRICSERGLGKRLIPRLSEVPPGCRVFTGVDLAVKKKKTSDYTVLFTILVWPNGDREVLNIERSKLEGPDIVQRIVDTHRAYQSTIIFEDNAAQAYIGQFTHAIAAVPMIPYHTSSKTYHPTQGIESLAIEMSNAKWIIPCEGDAFQPRYEPAVEVWLKGCFFFDPNAHPDDTVMAAFLAREGAQMFAGNETRNRFGIRILG